MPEWFSEVIVIGLAGILGFLGKEIVDRLRARRTTRRSELDELRRLRDLLKESESVFHSHNYQVRRLMALLQARLDKQLPTGLGFDETFYRLYDRMVEEEKELHALIRSTTVNSMKRLNEELQAWVEKNRQFYDANGSTVRQAFSEQLQLLKLHINQWHDKYAAIILHDQKRSLVYLADEKKHGTRFPEGLADALDKVISEYRGV